MNSLNPDIYNPFKGKQKGSRYNQEQLSFLQELVTLGWSASKISSTYKINKDSIKKRIKNNDWIVNGNNRNNKLSDEELLEIKEMVKNQVPYKEICQTFHISIEALLNRIANNKWERAKRKNLYTFNENYFDIINTEQKAYWLGFLYADGYILAKRGKSSQSFGFSISIEDNELLMKFKQDIQSNNPIHYYKNDTFHTNTTMGRILLTSQHTVDVLKNLGVVENKTFFLKAPPIEEKFFPAFIRGYSDGDGSIYITKNKKFGWSIVGTKELLDFIQKFLKTKNKLIQRFPDRKTNNYTLVYDGNIQVPKLLEKIYKDATIYLERKYQKYAEMRGI